MSDAAGVRSVRVLLVYEGLEKLALIVLPQCLRETPNTTQVWHRFVVMSLSTFDLFYEEITKLSNCRCVIIFTIKMDIIYFNCW